MKTTVRKALLADYRPIARILLEQAQNQELLSLEAKIKKGLQLAQGAHHPMTAVNEAGRVLGYALWHLVPRLDIGGPEAYLAEIRVEKVAQGQGVGKALLAAVQAQAQAQGCVRICLGIAGETGFFEKQGFKRQNNLGLTLELRA